MLISIIIASRNSEKYLKKCIESVLKEKAKNYEIIIVDDASEDNSIVVATPFTKRKNIHLIAFNKNGGVAKARNAGIRASHGKYIFIIDQDTKVSSGWYREVQSFFKRNSNTGAGLVKLLTMGTKRYDSAGDYISTFGFLVERAKGASDRGQFDSEDYVFAGKTAGLIVRRHVFDEIGGFDEDYKIYLEDTDFCWKIWLFGYKIRFAPRITVYHAYGTKPLSAYRYHKVFYRGCKNTLRTHMKNLGLRRLSYILPIQYLTWTMLTILFLVTGNFQRAGDLASGIVASIVLIPQTLTKRRALQKARKISDTELFDMVGTSRGLTYYFGKAKSYITSTPF